MGQDVAFACECGQIHGLLTDISEKTGTGLVCHCSQCRAAEVYLDQEDPKEDGVAIFQTTLDHVNFIAGADKMYAFSFDKDRLVHWYASCCKSPLFNTMSEPKTGFVSVMVDRLSDTSALGRIRAMLYVDDGTGKQKHEGLRHVIAAGMKRSAKMRLTKKWKRNDFFGKSGKPITRVHVLSEIEKRHLPLERKLD